MMQISSDQSFLQTIVLLEKLCRQHKVEECHGVQHALNVFDHANRALVESARPKSAEQRDAVRFAALLHDADDRKFFPESSDYENARNILEKVLPNRKNMHELIIKMIALVSCRQNGNSSREKIEEWQLIPRMSDRLEALGLIGVYRAYTYTVHVGDPLFLPSTPRVTNHVELCEVATKDRFDNYVNGIHSVSMMDHFYDKLLHIGNPNFLSIENPYLIYEATTRHQYMVDFVLDFGRTGSLMFE